MTLDDRLRGAVDRASNRAVNFILPNGKGLSPNLCKAIWRGPAIPPFTLPLDRIGSPFAQAAARRIEQDDPAATLKLLQSVAASSGAPYAVIGDSHSAQMVRRAQQGGRWLLPFHWPLRGASARGLGNDDGRSGASAAVTHALAAIEPHAFPVIFKFGQVDLEFVYAFKRIESGLIVFNKDHYADFVDETLSRYAAGLDALIPKMMRRRVVLASIFPPALSDEAWSQGYVNASIADQHLDQDAEVLARDIRRLEIPSLSTRTKMHARFNTKLKAAAADLGMTYLDCFTPFLGPDGLLQRKYRGERQGGDHHLSFRAARAHLIAGLWSVLGEPVYV